MPPPRHSASLDEPARYPIASHIGTIVGVSKQIAVRLLDEVVEFIDAQVRERHVASRAAFVHYALERERRRLIAARDAEILARDITTSDEFEPLAAYAADLDTDLG